MHKCLLSFISHIRPLKNVFELRHEKTSFEQYFLHLNNFMTERVRHSQGQPFTNDLICQLEYVVCCVWCSLFTAVFIPKSPLIQLAKNLPEMFPFPGAPLFAAEINGLRPWNNWSTSSKEDNHFPYSCLHWLQFECMMTSFWECEKEIVHKIPRKSLKETN